MAFSSVQFLFVFLPLTLALYTLAPKSMRNVVLALFSLLFFAWSGLRGAALLVGMTAWNWLGGLVLGHVQRKKPCLALLVAGNLLVLGVFKYAGFAARSVNALFPDLLPVLAPALPLGISFYIFTAIGYCVDVAGGTGTARPQSPALFRVSGVLRPRPFRPHRTLRPAEPAARPLQ